MSENQLPDGFEEVGRDIDGWGNLQHMFDTEQAVFGRIVEERLINKLDPDGQRRQVPILLIELDAPLTTLDKDGEEIQLENGQVLAFSVNYSMKNLQGHVTDRVYIKPAEKKRLGGGKSVWKLRLGIKSSGLPRPKALIPDSTHRVQAEPETETTDDLPF